MTEDILYIIDNLFFFNVIASKESTLKPWFIFNFLILPNFLFYIKTFFSYLNKKTKATFDSSIFFIYNF